MDVGMSLSDVAAAWALACQDAVCWESCPRVGVDASAGRIVPLPGGVGAGGAVGNGDYGRQAGAAGEPVLRCFCLFLFVVTRVVVSRPDRFCARGGGSTFFFNM